MRNRRPVDWEEEIRKTKEIQKKGFRTSLLSLLIAGAFIAGVKFYNPGAPFGRIALPLIFSLTAFLLVLWIIRRKMKN